MEDKQLLLSCIKAFSLPFEDRAQELLSYMDSMLEKNEVMNLTAVKDRTEAVIKHLADSLSLLKVVKMEADCAFLDVGTGAGFPAAVIAIARPDISVSALDGTGKRINFINETAARMQLKNLKGIHGRAELLAKDKAYRERYDYVTARAVASLPELCEYCLPFVKKGGFFAAMKSGAVDEELKAAENAVKTLGGKLSEIARFTLPCSDLQRAIVVIEKIAETPEKYPRASAVIAKRPL